MNESLRPNLTSKSTSSLLYRNVVVPNIIPPGTVATRIQYLQSLSSQSSSWTLKSKTHRRDNSRTAFGRRLTTRFGLPASRNTKPDEESQVEIAHTFRGLRTPRTKHTEDHVNSDCTPQPTRSQSPGLHNEFKPQRTVQRTNAAIPWAPLSRSKTTRSLWRKGTSPDSGILKDGKCSSNQRKYPSKMFIYPSSEPEDGQDTYGKINMREVAENSESTIGTTSTLRRKSVRELFERYGIERPEGLASSRETSREMDYFSVRHHRCCHLCSWVNSGVKCWRCGHKFCSKCNNLPPLPNTQKERDSNYVEKLPKQENSSPILTQSEAAKPSTRPLPTSLHSDGPTRKRSSTTESPAYVEQLVQMKETPPQQTALEPVLAAPLPSRRVRISVKEPPFLTTNLICPSQSLRLTPIDTDNGYTADTSMVEDSLLISTRPCSSTRVISQKGRRSTKSQGTPISGLLSRPLVHLKRRASVGPLCGNHFPEYMERHGYPRTSHSRRGSPVSSGIIGQYQHCLDDCECAACQNTHHNVRSFVHIDHPSMVDHHPTRKNATIPSCPTAIPEESKRASRADEKLDLELQVMPEPQIENRPESDYNTKSPFDVSRSPPIIIKLRCETSTRPISVDAHTSPPNGPFFSSLSWQKRPKLPQSKTSTFKTRPPTPPPWVENPRVSTSLGDPRKKDQTPERNGAETAFKIKDRLKSRKPYEQPNTPQAITSSRRRSSTKQISGRASRRLSTIFQLKSISPVPFLNQELREHQENLRRMNREVETGIARGSVERRVTAIEREKTVVDCSKPPKVDRPAARDSNRSDKKKWRLRLVDKKSDPRCCENDIYKFAEEHRLSGDEIITEMDGSGKDKTGAWSKQLLDDSNVPDHSWKDRFIEKGKVNDLESPKIKGITVILQLEGREDMVFRAESCTGAQMPELG